MMAAKGTHGKEGLSFENLSFLGQARSINGDIRALESALLAHFRKSEHENRDVSEIKNKRISQVLRMIGRLQKI